MKKLLIFISSFTLIINVLNAQDKNGEKEKGFKKENLFTGGSVSLAFYNNTFLIGASPVFGYSIAKWVDVGILANYNYTSYRDYNFVYNDKLRQTVYGGGVFAKIYPVRFLFAQAQFENNFIRQRYIPNIGTEQTYRINTNSFLVGGGYTTSRYPESGQPFFYLAVLFDVSNNLNSPYTDGTGRIIPIIRGGIQVPLFGGKGSGGYEERGNGQKRPRNYGR